MSRATSKYVWEIIVRQLIVFFRFDKYLNRFDDVIAVFIIVNQDG